MQARIRQTCLSAVVALGLVVATAGTTFAQPGSTNLGTWQLNLAKSTFAPGTAPKSDTFTNVVADAGITSTSDSVAADGTARIGALHSGMAAVAIVLFLIRSTMKNMTYFIRAEHFNLIGKLMLIVSMTWAYFYFNDYLVMWYGGDKWEKIFQEFAEKVPLAYLWFTMLICNVAVPWLILWNSKWRSTPWLLASVGVIINVGMWLVRYVIIPIGLSVNRMPFTWRLYVPAVEIFLTIGTISLFLLLYMLASRLIPLIPVWEVQEGQIAHMLRKVGKAHVPTVSDIE